MAEARETNGTDILLAGGVEDRLRTVARMLRRAGFAVREVADRDAAVAAATTAPDLFVLDVGTTAIEPVLEPLRADSRTRRIPVLLLLSATLPESEDGGLERGADAYLTQPVEAGVLAATVRSLLRARRAEREVDAAAVRWQTTFDAIGDGVAVVAADGTIERANRAFAGVVGVAAEELGGAGFAHVLPDVDVDTAAAGHARDVRRGDRTLALRVDAVPTGLGDGAAPGARIVTLSDVTARRRVEQVHAIALRRERVISRTLQQTLLPERLPSREGLRIIAWHQPAERDLLVGGDWYDAIETDAGLWLVMGDVAGHGVEAAAQAGQLRHSLRVYAHEGYALADAVASVNDLVMSADPSGFATLCIAALTGDAARFEVILAGHPPPLFLPAGGEPRLLETALGPALGVPRRSGQTTTHAFEPGDRLVLYTDGLVERKGEPLDNGLERLQRVASGLTGLEPLRAGLVAGLVDVGELRDDVALLLAERR